MTDTTSTAVKFNPDLKKYQLLLSNMHSSWKMGLYLLFKLPTVLWWGIKVTSISPEKSEVKMKYNWRNTNPYKSAYFAAMSGAAELSTGLLSNLVLNGFEQKISMLVIDFQAQFTKKVTKEVTFTCTDGAKIISTIEEAAATGEAREVEMWSIGRNEKKEEVAKVRIVWSYKVKG